MSTTNKIIIAIIAVIVIAGGVWLLMANQKAGSPSASQNGSQASQSSTTSQDETMAMVTFTYDGNGFSPASATIKSGGMVKIINKSDKEIEFASNPHPVHTDNPELNTGDIEPGKDTTITVTKKGTWGFHNHYDHSKSGTLTVE